MGGTIEDISYDPGLRLGGSASVLACLARAGLALPVEAPALLAAIERGSARYRAWSEKTMVEAPAKDVWAEWYLGEFALPRGAIDSLAPELARIWETQFHSRRIRPEARACLEALRDRGYLLGVISNTSSEDQVLGTLEGYGIRQLFDCVCLSCVSGIRKPDPRIFHEACALLGVEASGSAYVGDTVSRDIAGAKAAGYALSFQIPSFMTPSRDSGLGPSSPRPDYLIGGLGEIVTILDGLGARPL